MLESFLVLYYNHRALRTSYREKENATNPPIHGSNTYDSKRDDVMQIQRESNDWTLTSMTSQNTWRICIQG